MGGILHYFPGLSMRDILWRYSYTNLVMLVSSIPSYNLDKEKNKELEIKDISEIGDLL